MKKACIYNVDSLPGGEMGIEKLLSQEGYNLNAGIIYDKNGLARGKMISGTYFGVLGSLELHILDDPVLEKLIDDYQTHASGQASQPGL